MSLAKPFRNEEARCEAAGIISEVRVHDLRDSSPRRSRCGARMRLLNQGLSRLSTEQKKKTRRRLTAPLRKCNFCVQNRASDALQSHGDSEDVMFITAVGRPSDNTRGDDGFAGREVEGICIATACLRFASCCGRCIFARSSFPECGDMCWRRPDLSRSSFLLTAPFALFRKPLADASEDLRSVALGPDATEE